MVAQPFREQRSHLHCEPWQMGAWQHDAPSGSVAAGASQLACGRAEPAMCAFSTRQGLQ